MLCGEYRLRLFPRVHELDADRLCVAHHRDTTPRLVLKKNQHNNHRRHICGTQPTIMRKVRLISGHSYQSFLTCIQETCNSSVGAISARTTTTTTSTWIECRKGVAYGYSLQHLLWWDDQRRIVNLQVLTLRSYIAGRCMSVHGVQ